MYNQHNHNYNNNNLNINYRRKKLSTKKQNPCYVVDKQGSSLRVNLELFQIDNFFVSRFTLDCG